VERCKAAKLNFYCTFPLNFKDGCTFRPRVRMCAGAASQLGRMPAFLSCVWSFTSHALRAHIRTAMMSLARVLECSAFDSVMAMAVGRGVLSRHMYVCLCSNPSTRSPSAGHGQAVAHRPSWAAPKACARSHGSCKSAFWSRTHASCSCRHRVSLPGTHPQSTHVE
jgi:hypothetical protein